MFQMVNGMIAKSYYIYMDLSIIFNTHRWKKLQATAQKLTHTKQ